VLRTNSGGFVVLRSYAPVSAPARGVPDITVVFGVDFSGAKLAGRNTWLARMEPPGRGHDRRWRLADLACLESLCGTGERTAALGHLVERIGATHQALWALDFPFGLPVEIMETGASWPDQLDLLRTWGEDAYGLGAECLRRAKDLGGPNHIRRQTDAEAKTPFDCYHYRIVYQMFYGMRDVLAPLAGMRRTAVLPFQYRRLGSAQRVLVEACPGSTLKRLGLPHQNYKQPAGGALTALRRRTRRTLLAGLARHVVFDDSQQRVMMRNGGGDALDALIAAVGGLQAWQNCDHRLIARHPRYPREGRLFI
jgi:hypothetical protein